MKKKILNCEALMGMSSSELWTENGACSFLNTFSFLSLCGLLLF